MLESLKEDPPKEKSNNSNVILSVLKTTSMLKTSTKL